MKTSAKKRNRAGIPICPKCERPWEDHSTREVDACIATEPNESCETCGGDRFVIVVDPADSASHISVRCRDCKTERTT